MMVLLLKQVHLQNVGAAGSGLVVVQVDLGCAGIEGLELTCCCRYRQDSAERKKNP